MPSASEITIRLALAGDYVRIRLRYPTCGYTSGLTPSDTRFIAQVDQRIIGVSQVVFERGTVVVQRVHVSAD